MLVIPFWTDDQAYAVASVDLLGVLPRPRLRVLPDSPPGLLGVFEFRGRWTPVLDAQWLLGGRAAAPALATRLLLCRTATPGEALGLLCERVTDALTVEDEAWAASGVELAQAPWLGPLTTRDGLTLQRLRVARILTPELIAALAAEPAP